MKRILAFATLFIVFCLPVVAQTTAVPSMMNFQGRLAKPDGTPVLDGNYALTFRIWDAATGGLKRWEQMMNPVLVHNGAFSVLLGNGNPLSETILNNTPYLEIQVGADTPLPRQAFASTAFAFKANLATTVPDGAITSAKIAINSVTNDKIAYDSSSLYKVSAGVIGNVNGNISLLQDRFMGLLPDSSAFNYGGKTFGEYALGWYGDNYNLTGAPLAWLSGYGGIKFFTGSVPRMIIDVGGNVGINTINPQSTLDVNGTITASAMQVTGADVAEPYKIAATQYVQPKPGIVVTLDAKHPGGLQVASRSYDRTVAGIISGANGVKPGVVLRQPGTLADGDLPVASVGRVYCWCDADANGAIAIGDMLTTSNTPGHAMRVTDHNRAQGAIIGKAMSSLKSGRGMVLVLVTLQ